MVEKSNFLKVAKSPYPKNRFLVTLKSFFSMYNFFAGRGWLFPVSMFKEEYFSEKMSSLAGPKKVIQFTAKVLFLAIFGCLGPPSVDFLKVQAKFRKISAQFPAVGCKEHCVKF